MFLKVLIGLSLVVIMLGCGSSLSKDYTKETFKKDIEELKKSGDLDSSSIIILINYIEVGKNVEGSYKEILHEANNEHEQVCSVVNEFLIQINDKTKTVDKSILHHQFDSIRQSFPIYTSSEWELRASKENDSTYVVESIGNTFDGKGRPRKITQNFAVVRKKEGWEIFNSYNFMALNLDFKIVDTDWDFYWDMNKYSRLKNLKDN